MNSGKFDLQMKINFLNTIGSCFKRALRQTMCFSTVNQCNLFRWSESKRWYMLFEVDRKYFFTCIYKRPVVKAAILNKFFHLLLLVHLVPF